jgi:hypothetical protein
MLGNLPGPNLKPTEKLYFGIGAAVLGFYLVSEHRGTIYFESDQRAAIPASVRSSPGGYRSHGFWYSGFQGGK